MPIVVNFVYIFEAISVDNVFKKIYQRNKNRKSKFRKSKKNYYYYYVIRKILQFPLKFV